MQTTHTLLLPLALATLLASASAHGLNSWPRQRGALAGNNFNMPMINPDAPPDYCPHCLNGGGTGAVSSHAKDRKWTPYEPTDPSFLFREDHGMCGDPLGSRNHMAPDGEYVTGETIATYEQGDYIDMEAHVSAHHNGFFEYFACSLDCCGTDDIEKKCFQNGCCKKLMRVPHKSCESGFDRICGPVDPKHPGRWYLPPRDQKTPEDNWYGGLNKKMRYALPKDMTCERCVIHWSWTTANSCNPPGYAEYKFPQKWDGIPGDGGSLGAINRAFATCGDEGANFPEEFWSCSENVRIAPPNSGKSRTLQTFYNGQMNVEGPNDSNSPQLGDPFENPNDKPTTGKDTEEPVPTKTPKASPSSKPSPVAMPSYKPSGTNNPPPSKEDGSRYNLTAHLSSYDTGVCVKARGGRSFCQACLNLGYGVTKCMWCHAGRNGKETCLHVKPKLARK